MAKVIKSPITQHAWFAFWFASFLTFSAWLFFSSVADMPDTLSVGGHIALFLVGFVASLAYLHWVPARLSSPSCCNG